MVDQSLSDNRTRELNRWQEQQFSGDDDDGDKENIFHISKKWQNLLVFATCGGAQGTVLFLASETNIISYYQYLLRK